MEADFSVKFSPSKLSVYQDCPRRYQYRYVDRIKRDYDTVESVLGRAAHKALEELYKTRMHGRTLSRAETIQAFESEWQQLWSDSVVFHDARYTKDDWLNVGRNCLEGYYAQHAPFDSDRTVAVEKRVGFDLQAGGDTYRIEGFIDRLALRSDHILSIHDYKTSGSLPTQEEIEKEWQLPIYEIAVRQAWPDVKEVELVWHYLRFSKTLRSRRSASQQDALKARLADSILAVKRDHEFKPNKSALCDWCEYRDLCPLWGHAEKVKAMDPEARSQDDGVRLVGELAAIESKRRAYRDELKKLETLEDGVKARLLRFADEHGVSVVCGESGDATLSDKEEFKLAARSSDPAAVEALETALKDTPIWKEVSRLDGPALMDGYRRKKWPAAMLKVIESFIGKAIRFSRMRTVRFKMRKEEEE